MHNSERFTPFWFFRIELWAANVPVFSVVVVFNSSIGFCFKIYTLCFRTHNSTPFFLADLVPLTSLLPFCYILFFSITTHYVFFFFSFLSSSFHSLSNIHISIVFALEIHFCKYGLVEKLPDFSDLDDEIHTTNMKFKSIWFYSLISTLHVKSIRRFFCSWECVSRKLKIFQQWRPTILHSLRSYSSAAGVVVFFFSSSFLLVSLIFSPFDGVVVVLLLLLSHA